MSTELKMAMKECSHTWRRGMVHILYTITSYNLGRFNKYYKRYHALWQFSYTFEHKTLFTVFFTHSLIKKEGFIHDFTQKLSKLAPPDLAPRLKLINYNLNNEFKKKLETK